MVLRPSSSSGDLRPRTGGRLADFRRPSTSGVATEIQELRNASKESTAAKARLRSTFSLGKGISLGREPGGEIVVSRGPSKESTAPSSTFEPDEPPPEMPTRLERRLSRKDSMLDADPNKIRLPLGLISQMANGVRKLSAQLNLPFDDTHRAVNIFARFTDVQAGSDVMDAQMFRGQFAECLNYTMQMRGASSEAAEEIVERCFKTCDKDGSGSIDAEEFCIWYASESFSQEMLLDEKTQGIRKFAEEHGISVADIDRYKTYFNKFDEDGSGAIEYDEFSKLVTILWKVPKNAEIPEKRLRGFWQMADLDGSGSLEFEEFVLFYIKYCEVDSDGDPITDFYRNVRRV